MTTIFLAGSGAFGLAAAEALTDDGHTIVGVCSPAEGRRGRHDPLRLWADRTSTPWSDVTVLRPDDVPDGTDLILTAHSHAFIGRRTRARAAAALGYHPSLLPLHRGRDAVRWTIRNHDRVTGGTIYHLTDRVDGGPIAFQEYVIIPDGIDASQLWSDHLFPLGIDLLRRTANWFWDQKPMYHDGNLPYRPQNDALATWEPSLGAAPLHRPELLELTTGAERP